jgi:hypothetical protein
MSSLDLSDFQDTLAPVSGPIRDPWAVPGQPRTPRGASATMPGEPLPTRPEAPRTVSPRVLLLVSLIAAAVAIVGIRTVVDGLILTRDEAVAGVVQNLVDAVEQGDVAGLAGMSTADRRWDAADPNGDSEQDLLLASIFDEIAAAEVVSFALEGLEQTATPNNAHVQASVSLRLRTGDATARYRADLDGWLRNTDAGWRVSSLGLSDLR